MPTCKKCSTACSEEAHFCSNCGNPLSSDESPISISVGEDVGDMLLDQGQGEGEAAKRLICPRCKILYERGSTCIRCRSPLVQRGALAEGEELKPTAEAKKEMPLLVEAPGFKVEEAKGPKQEIPLKALGNETPMDEAPKDQAPKIQPKQHQRVLNRLQVEVARKGTLRKSKMDRALHLSFESAKILILIGAAGYLLWSVTSHFLLERPEARVSTPKGSDTLTATSTPPEISEASGAQSHEPRPPQPSPQTSSAGPAGEAEALEDIRDTLEKIKKGNLGKDIELFMACYSPSFKNREEKRRETLRTWENFNYQYLTYDLKTCTVSGSIARATVEWRILFCQKAGGPPEEGRTVLNVTLERREDGWKILEVQS